MTTLASDCRTWLSRSADINRDSGASGGSGANGGSGASGGSDIALQFAVVFDGWALRRQSDACDAIDVTERTALIERIWTLQDEIIDRLDPVCYPSPLAERAGEIVAERLAAEKKLLADALTRPDLDWLHRATLLEGFRSDLLWLSSVGSSLVGDKPASSGLLARVALERLQQTLAQVSPTFDPDGKRKDVDDDVRRLRRTLLERRIEHEIQRPIIDVDPDRLWGRRFVLTRLQAEIENDSPGEGDWASRIARRRNELADAAESRLHDISPIERRPLWETIVLAARGECNDTSAFLEDLPLPSAVHILELLHEDFNRLGHTGAQLNKLDANISDPTLKTSSVSRQLRRFRRWSRGELQEKRLALRLDRLLGRSVVAWMESSVLVLVLFITALIFAEWAVETYVGMTHAWEEFFAWTDLVVCSVFLAEFTLKWSQSDDRWLYFRRHFLVDFLASIPFGFIVHHAAHLEMHAAENAPQLLRLLRFLRLPQLARYLKALRPVLRVFRLFVFALRAIDQLVRRHARLFNRNLVLFEPTAGDEEDRRLLRKLAGFREYFNRRSTELLTAVPPAARLEFLKRSLADLDLRVRRLPQVEPQTNEGSTPPREVRAETVVDRLLEMTAEQFVEELGQPLADSIYRLVRLFDVVGIRRLPLIRGLVAQRQRGAAEVAALAANYLGYLLQTTLNVVYYFADLQGTITGPVFLDRLGATIINATSRPAKRLLMLGAIVSLLSFLLTVASLPTIVHDVARKVEKVFGWPVIILGLICLVPWLLGIWFRKIANQATEFCERVAEAQFAAQTKALKSKRKSLDFQLLTERVLLPELRLRRCDDPASAGHNADIHDENLVLNPEDSLRPGERGFIRPLRLIHQEYLDGALFHRSDTKTATQILGNLALRNFRLSNLAQALRENKRLQTLDLARTSGSLLGGPYLWFNYITRLITQQTARLLLDFNQHAIPLERLPAVSPGARQRYREWLSRRLGVPPESIIIPGGAAEKASDETVRPVTIHSRVNDFVETVDFTALDFLTAEADRDHEIAIKFGPQVAELLKRDREDNVRRAFRCYPLHRIPLAERTVNPLAVYESYLAGGRVLLLPFHAAMATARLLTLVVYRVYHVIRDVLHPHVVGAEEAQENVGVDTYAVAERKIHRMRKPIFMESLWLRARFDIEYVGLRLPGVPCEGLESMLQTDLDFIGASRRDRLIADRLHQEQRVRVEWVGRWLDEFGLGFDRLPAYLAEHCPFLQERAAETVRALATAFVLDHDDLWTLAVSYEGIRRMVKYASDPDSDPQALPDRLPPVVDLNRPLWRPVRRSGRPTRQILVLAGLDQYTAAQEKRVIEYLRRHRTYSSGWINVLRGQAEGDAVATLRRRMREVICRTDLWSDQIVAMRTIQALALLDVYHYCEMVWKLGGYERLERDPFDTMLPLSGARATCPAK